MSHSCGCHHDDSVAPANGRRPTRVGVVAPEETIEAIGRRSPRALPTLRGFGIDTCCGGRLTLAQAVASAGVPLETVMRALGEDNGETEGGRSA